MSLEEIRQFESPTKKPFLIEALHQQNVLSDDDMETMRQAASEVRQRRLTYSAVTRWLNSKPGVDVSQTSVRNYLLSLS